MKLILKSIFLLSEEESFQEFVPEIPHNFHVLASVTIGEVDNVAADDYSLGICTPAWLDHHIQNVGPISGRHLLIVNRFDAKEIRASIEEIINQCERPASAETYAVLARFFAWEFEDYQS